MRAQTCGAEGGDIHAPIMLRDADIADCGKEHDPHLVDSALSRRKHALPTSTGCSLGDSALSRRNHALPTSTGCSPGDSALSRSQAKGFPVSVYFVCRYS